MDPQQLSDRELFDRVAMGASDAATWSAFVSRFSRLCYHAIHRVISRHSSMSPADADELFQRLFERILDNERYALRRFRGDNGCTPATYLSHLATYQALEFVRQRERVAREVSASHVESRRRVSEEELVASPEVEVERNEAVLAVHDALAQLSASDRLLYRLHYERGMDLTEVARFMSRTETAVHVQHHRLKERLRKLLLAAREDSHVTG